MVLGTLGTNLIGNILVYKGMKVTWHWREVIRARERVTAFSQGWLVILASDRVSQASEGTTRARKNC